MQGSVSVDATSDVQAGNLPPPAYPVSAVKKKANGTVVLEVRVGTDGKARDVRVATSSGSPELDRSALAAARAWTFQPATENGKPAAATVRVPVRFDVDARGSHGFDVNAKAEHAPSG